MLANCSSSHDVVARVFVTADGDDRFDERTSEAAHAPKAPDVVQAHDAHALGVLLACHGLDHQLVYAVGIFRLDIGQRDALIGHLGAFGHGEDHVVRAGHAAVQLHARPQVLHVRHKHRFRPRYARIGVQGVDDQRLASPSKRAGIHAHFFHSEGQLIAFQPLPEQVHGLHFWGVLGRGGGGQEYAAFRDFADFAVDGSEEVALVRCRMLPEEHTRIDGGFPFQTGNQRETFPVEPDQLGRRPVAETLRHPVDEMETGIVEDLETLLHDSPPISCGTGCTGPCGTAPCRAFRGISCSCRGRPPCGRG